MLSPDIQILQDELSSLELTLQEKEKELKLAACK